MKIFLKLLVIVFMAVLGIVSEPQELHAQILDNTGSIQSYQNENVELVSNNLYTGEISAYQEEESPNSSGNSSHLLSFVLKTDSLINNKTLLDRDFIHNLSTNLSKIKQIRAP
ncbi:hypothetical protein IJD34_02890 [bacterium]|nr:hypothetical protein [bacterium]